MPGLPVIPEVDHSAYDSYARQMAKRRRMRPGNAWTSVAKRNNYNAPKREPKPDYYGLDNSMKKMTLNKPRKWRTKENEDKQAWESTTYNERKNKETQEDDKASVASVDRHILRKSRSSLYAKFKYPEKFHHGFQCQQAQLEENIPRCLKKYPRYANQAVRQDCQYNPVRSVTQLNVHSIKSFGLPHPNHNGAVTKKRRPTSAPPGSMTSYNNLNSSFNKANSFTRTNSSRSSAGSRQRPQTAIGHRSQELFSEDLDRNGSFQYSYDEEVEEEGPSHVTLEVIDSDDDDNNDVNSNDDVKEFQSSQPSTARSFNGYSDKNRRYSDRGESEHDVNNMGARDRRDSSDKTKPSENSDVDEVASDVSYSEDDYVYSDRESLSAKSVDSEPEYF